MQTSINPATPTATKWYEEMEISRLAYTLWQQAGRPPERYMQFWDKAEAQVLAARTAKAGKPTATGLSRTIPAPEQSGPVRRQRNRS
ncbi:MAG: hypothetical protein DME26_14440 [Verrucomicrobia bacterium]|nr:MAG: hypothetical protein DME26_14440 [Verrucomicrobiota bacterium]